LVGKLFSAGELVNKLFVGAALFLEVFVKFITSGGGREETGRILCGDFGSEGDSFF
jgi:hypothetical protein